MPAFQELTPLFPFLVVFLSPILPAILIFLFINPDKIVAGTGGTIFGLTIKAGGGFGAYVILAVLANFTYSHVQPTTQTARLYLELSGPKPVVNRVASQASSLGLLLTSDDAKAISIRFERFAVQNDGKTLTSSLEIPKGYIGLKYRGTLTGAPSGIRDTIGPVGSTSPNSTSFTLDSDTTLTLTVANLSDDPLNADDKIFHTDSWTEALLLTDISFNKLPDKLSDQAKEAIQKEPNIKASETADSLMVFMNEGSQNLGEIALTGYYNDNRPNSHPIAVEAIARKLSNEEHLALSLPLEKSKNFFANDGSDVFASLQSIMEAYKKAGSEIGFVRVKDFEHASNRGDLELRGTELRIGPLKEAIKPGEGVAVLVRFVYEIYWEPIVPDMEDSVTQRVMFPTRLWILSIRLAGGEVRFNPSSLAVDFTMRDHAHQSELAGLQKKLSDQYLTLQANTINGDTTGRFSWRWAQP